MEDFLSIIGALLMLAASVLILKCFGFKGAPVVGAVAMITLSTSLFERLPQFLSLFEQLRSFVQARYVDSAVRIVGIGYLGGISADLCRELGEGGIAKCVNTVARLEVITIATPYVAEIFASLTELIGAG